MTKIEGMVVLSKHDVFKFEPATMSYVMEGVAYVFGRNKFGRRDQTFLDRAIESCSGKNVPLIDAATGLAMSLVVVERMCEDGSIATVEVDGETCVPFDEIVRVWKARIAMNQKLAEVRERMLPVGEQLADEFGLDEDGARRLGLLTDDGWVDTKKDW